jgi:hypothetical protein
MALPIIESAEWEPIHRWSKLNNFFSRLRLPAPDAILIACRNKLPEQRVRLKWFRLELGMKLAAEEVGMAGNLDNLNIRGVWCSARNL